MEEKIETLSDFTFRAPDWTETGCVIRNTDNGEVYLHIGHTIIRFFDADELLKTLKGIVNEVTMSR